MPRLVYKLWVSGDIIDQWSNPKIAYDETRTYFDEHPEIAHLLHFGVFKLGTRELPALPVFSVSGVDIIEYFDDIQGEAEEDEWTGE